MKCHICNNEMREGYIKVQDNGFNILNTVTWYPIEEKPKKIHKEYIKLKLEADAFYCETCMHSVAIFD